jgi:hypothetical protein
MSRSKLFRQNIKNRLTSDSGFFLVSAHIVIAGVILLLIAIILFITAPFFWGIIFLLISLGIIAAGAYKYIKYER